jgi:hypothetical protein
MIESLRSIYEALFIATILQATNETTNEFHDFLYKGIYQI